MSAGSHGPGRVALLEHFVPVRRPRRGGGFWMTEERVVTPVRAPLVPGWVRTDLVLPMFGGAGPRHHLVHEGRAYGPCRLGDGRIGPAGPPFVPTLPGDRPLSTSFPPVDRPLGPAVAAVRDHVERGGVIEVPGDGHLVALPPPMLHARGGGVDVRAPSGKLGLAEWEPRMPGSLERADAYLSWMSRREDLARHVDKAESLVRRWGPVVSALGDDLDDVGAGLRLSLAALLRRAGLMRVRPGPLREVAIRSMDDLAPFACLGALGILYRTEWPRAVAACAHVADTYAGLAIAAPYRAWYATLSSYLTEFVLPHVPAEPVPEADSAALALVSR